MSTDTARMPPAPTCGQRPDPDLFDLLSAPVDAPRAALLDAIAGDPLHQADRERIVDALLADADEHNGQIVPDRVRARLSTPNGDLIVFPRLLSAMYGHLARAGVLQVDGWTVSQDRHGGNHGKPARTYRLASPR